MQTALYGKIKERKKSMQTALYGKIKERKGEWLIGASTKNLLHLSLAATQHKTHKKARKACKARRHAGAC